MRSCRCDRSQEFEAGQCHKCGHAVGRASTTRLAMVLAEVALGHRSIGGHKGDNLGTRKRA